VNLTLTAWFADFLDLYSEHLLWIMSKRSVTVRGDPELDAYRCPRDDVPIEHT
jgi:hypothetical protein